VAVEFDGDEHYRHTIKIKSDHEKDELARQAQSADIGVAIRASD
jgi:hypothetical protein